MRVIALMITAVVVSAVASGTAIAAGAPPTAGAPWVYINEGMYETDFPRREDLQTWQTQQEQREVVEGALRTAGNTARAVAPPPEPGNVAEAVGAFLGGVADGITGALLAAGKALF